MKLPKTKICYFLDRLIKYNKQLKNQQIKQSRQQLTENNQKNKGNNNTDRMLNRD